MTRDQYQLLHSLGYLYLRHGQNGRALALLMIAAKAAPDDPAIAKTMAYALLANGEPEEALKMVGRYESRSGDTSPRSPINIVKSRALRALGYEAEAKAVFQRFARANGVVDAPPTVETMVGARAGGGPIIDVDGPNARAKSGRQRAIVGKERRRAEPATRLAPERPAPPRDGRAAKAAPASRPLLTHIEPDGPDDDMTADLILRPQPRRTPGR